MIKHIKCDIFESGADVILHQVNCQGVMGSGIAKQVREKFPKVYKEYKMVCKDTVGNPALLLGTAQCVAVDDGKYIVNLFAQEDFGYSGQCYTDYNALKKCLRAVKRYPMFDDKVIAIPYLMSCARGGGNWDVVYKMIEDVFKDNDVLICEYNGG